MTTEWGSAGTRVRAQSEAERARAQAEHAEANLRAVITASPLPIITFDAADGLVQSWNGAAQRMFGWSEEEVIGRLSPLVPPERLAEFHSFRERVLRGEELRDVEVRRRKKDGSWIDLQLSAAALRDATGHLCGTMLVCADITARKQAEEALRTSEEQLQHLARALEQRVVERTSQLAAALQQREAEIDERRRVEEALRASDASFRLLFAANPLPVWVFDLETLRFLEVNEATVAQYGYSREELLGMQITDIRPPEDVPRLLDHLSLPVPDWPRQPAQWRHRYKNGQIIDVEITVHHLDFAGRRAGLVLAQDVTARRRAEAEQARQIRNAALRADVSMAFTQHDAASLAGTLQRCTDAVVQHLDAAFAHIWTLNPQQDVLELQASAGLYTQVDGPASRIPVGVLKPGLIAQQRRPHLTNDVLHDPGIQDPTWAQREGMRAFAGYPLLVADRVVGVLALFARRPLPEDTLEALASVADIIAQGIERQWAQDAIQRARDEAEVANRAKSEFLSRMSHELRTPLNAILGFTQVLELRDLGPRGNEGVQYILKAGRHLLQLIDEVLDISRIEAGHMTISPEPVAVAQSVREVLDLARPLAVARQIQLIDDVGFSEEPHIEADQQRFKQVLLNLVSNAIKYNREGGLVTLSCVEQPGRRLRLLVQDTGAGLRSDELARLFVPFERLGAAQTRVEGTGIGLALCKRLVEMMGGTVGVQSVVGEGSVFWVELPLAESGLARQMRLQSAGQVAGNPPVLSGQRTVLYVEDNLSNLTLLEHVLSRAPEVRLLTAMQGSLGLELAREHRPDLILLDMHLPDLMGDEVLRRLQAEPRTRAIPVVVLSADAVPAHIARVRAAGAAAYLTKPLDVKRFLATLEEILNGKAH